jgi:hypothetical protein
MATILAQRASTDTPVAKSDDHHEQLAADPTIPQFPQGSSYGTTVTAPSSNSTFGTPSSGGFGSTSSFGSPASTGFGNSSGFGAPTGGFGSSNNNMGSIGTSNMNVSTGNQPVLTGAGNNAAQDADILVANDKESEHWINSKWRPAMGWLYMATCLTDFIVFPILWSLLQALSKGAVTSQWQPLTLQGAGLYHIAMGAVLGIAAYGRTKEKVAGAN